MIQKVIITGSGRSGTTFLIQLLGRLGFDTGISDDFYDSKVRAGCEHPFPDLDKPVEELRQTFANLPVVLKAPTFSIILKYSLLNKLFEVEHVFMPVRELEESARSRLDVELFWETLQTEDEAQRINDQANTHAIAIGRTIEAVVMFGLPLTMLHFPRMVIDAEYCYQKICEWQPVDYNYFLEVFQELANPQQIKWSPYVENILASQSV